MLAQTSSSDYETLTWLKSIEGANVTCRNMHGILRGHKIRTIFATISISLRILSHLRIFELKKVSQRESKEKRNDSNFEPSQSYACTDSRVIVSFDDFLSHLKDPRVQLCRFRV